jgi:DNA-binding transcriptional MerR regulator
MSASLPPKLYFRIGEVAGLVGVEPHVLRYWEREFRTIRPQKSAKGQRVYSRKDVENLIRVKDLLYSQGFTIAGARKKLKSAGDGEAELLSATGTSADVGPPPSSAPASAIPASAIPASPPPVAAVAAAAASAAPAVTRPSVAPASAPPSKERETLAALRREIQAFLEELGG